MIGSRVVKYAVPMFSHQVSLSIAWREDHKAANAHRKNIVSCFQAMVAQL